MRRLFTSAILLFAAAVVFAQTSIKVETHNVVAVDVSFNITCIIE